MRRIYTCTATFLSLVLGCSKPEPKPIQPEQEAKVVPADGMGESVKSRVGPNPAGQPAEMAPPNVPEFSPAFESQTRAVAVHTRNPFRVSELAGPFDKPWALAFLPDGRMLVTEKHTGQLVLLGAQGERKSTVGGVPPVDGRDQGGLLDVEPSPSFASDQWLYLSYYEPREGGNGLAVARLKFEDGQTPKLHTPEVVFRMLPTLDSTKHAGGRLVFAPDGTLFVTLGERSIPEGRKQARDLASHFGKVVRIHPDGKVPADNPFVSKEGAKSEIWTLGHRNVLGADLDEKKRLWWRRWAQGGETNSTSWSVAKTTVGRRSVTGRSIQVWQFTNHRKHPVWSNPCTIGIR